MRKSLSLNSIDVDRITSSFLEVYSSLSGYTSDLVFYGLSLLNIITPVISRVKATTYNIWKFFPNMSVSESMLHTTVVTFDMFNSVAPLLWTKKGIIL